MRARTVLATPGLVVPAPVAVILRRQPAPGAVMFRKLRLRFAKKDHFDWHQCGIPLFGARDVDGRPLRGLNQIWRRLTENGRWKYTQSPTVESDYLDNDAW